MYQFSRVEISFKFNDFITMSMKKDDFFFAWFIDLIFIDSTDLYTEIFSLFKRMSHRTTKATL